ncbi:MAG TPA: thioredoxin domain-containing protein [Polyangiaceae bacterium]|nr:thioredoxin domain-containing protein [Polyangiaceae bacterium]
MSITSKVPVRWALVVALCAFTAPGCKKNVPPGDTAPAGSAAALGGKGACSAYASQLCDATGKESSTCAAVTTTTALLPASACSAALKEVKYSLDKLSEKRKACDELVSKLCAAVGKETESCQMVTTQTKQFPPERCEQMLPKLPEIVSELKKREEANKPLSSEAQALIAGGSAPAFGSASARVTIVEFSDFECPYCSRAAEVTKQIKEKYGDKVRFVFRQFPLSFHQNAKLAAEASLAANAQGKFWEFHDLLFANQQKLDAASLDEHAKKVGLNMGAFKASLGKHEFAATVDADTKLGEQVSVQGTPTMFINGARVANPTDFAALSAQIEQALGSPSPG